MDDKNLCPKKRYTQHYRKKWEDIPQLRGWLSMFPHKNPERTKAFCKYCQRKLVPHVTGLLKHAACRAHLKASRAYMDRIRDGIRRAEEKAKQQTVLKETASSTPPRVIVPSTSTDPEVTETEDGVPKITVLVQDVQDDPDEDNIDMDRDIDDDDNDDDNHMLDEHSTLIQDPLSQQVKIRVVMDDALLSTSIIDTTKGQPVVGLGVSYIN